MIIVGASLMFLASLWFSLWMRLPNALYEFDHGPNGAMGTFFPLLVAYNKFFYVVAAAGLGLALYAHHLSIEGPALILLISATEAMLFNGMIIVLYESYLASRYPRNASLGSFSPSNYTAEKHALILSLGISSVVLLLFGVALACWMVG